MKREKKTINRDKFNSKMPEIYSKEEDYNNRRSKKL